LKIIILEKHYQDVAVATASAPSARTLSPDFAAAYHPWNQAQLQFCVATLGTERIVYSVDYRFVGNEGAAEFLAAAEFSDDAKEAVAHGTAEPLLGL
jgi:predicted TIM-barrel fold metal-dependent hydrolase